MMEKWRLVRCFNFSGLVAADNEIHAPLVKADLEEVRAWILLNDE